MSFRDEDNEHLASMHSAAHHMADMFRAVLTEMGSHQPMAVIWACAMLSDAYEKALFTLDSENDHAETEKAIAAVREYGKACGQGLFNEMKREGKIVDPIDEEPVEEEEPAIWDLVTMHRPPGEN